MRPNRAISGIWLAAFLASACFTASASATSYGVMAWGARGNSSPGFKLGQLGNGGENGSSVPVAVSGLSEVTDISGGLDYSLALLADGTVKSWGDNTFAELGTGSSTGPESCETRAVPCSRLPVAVSGLSGVRAVSAGDGFGLALLENGKVMAWGENRYGQLGNGANTGPERCEASGTLAGPCGATPTAVNGLGEVIQIAAGKGFALALLSSGKVMAWGNNAAGELGDGTTTAKSEPVEVQGLGGVLAISAGYNEGLALLSSGKVMAWGGNVHAQLGHRRNLRSGKLRRGTVQQDASGSPGAERGRGNLGRLLERDRAPQQRQGDDLGQQRVRRARHRQSHRTGILPGGRCGLQRHAGGSQRLEWNGRSRVGQ